MCDPLSKAECVRTFARESKRGPFVREVEKRNERRSEIKLLLIVRGHREPGNVCILKRGGIKEISLAAQSHAVTEGGKAPVSACKRLCAIFLRKPSVYPLSGVKANVGHLCEKLKNGMRSGLEQRCDGNFWTIFAGTILGEKPNFTGRFSEW